MRYHANPCSPAVLDAMRAGHIGLIDTPAQGNIRPAGVPWIADNGCFSDRWQAESWWSWLTAQTDRGNCLFAVAPDVVGDAWATQMRAIGWLPRIRSAGYRVAYVAQDGARGQRLPWGWFDALFVGGSTAWKLGWEARSLVSVANRHGIHTHMGRVNSARRWRYAEHIGCDTVDGTYLTFGPDKNLPRLLGWAQPSLLGSIS